MFRLGPALWRLGSIDRSGFNLGEAVRPELRRLVEATGETASFLAQNAGKRSLTLNLKSPKGREAFSRLVATADVVVENFRAGVMERVGLGYAAL